MSYDLNFWRYDDEARARTPDEHRDLYLALCRGETPAGLAPLPVAAILARFDEAMAPAGWTWDGFAWVRPGAVIEQRVQAHHVRLDLRGRWGGDDVNPLIDIMAGEFGCPLYDPQVGTLGERFGLSGRVAPGGSPRGGRP